MDGFVVYIGNLQGKPAFQFLQGQNRLGRRIVIATIATEEKVVPVRFGERTRVADRLEW